MDLTADAWRTQRVPTSVSANFAAELAAQRAQPEARKSAATPPPPLSAPPPPQATRGDAKPHCRLPLSYDEMLLRKQANELRILFRLRDPRLTKWSEIDDAISAAGVDLGRLYDPLELGEHVRFTVAEDQRFATEALGRKDGWYKRKGKMVRRRANRFPASFIPAGFSKLETKQRRALFNRPRKAEDARRRRAALVADKADRVQTVADLDCRLSATSETLTDQFQTIHQIMAGVAGANAFLNVETKRPLTGGSLKKALQRALDELVRSGEAQRISSWHPKGLPMTLYCRPPGGDGQRKEGK
jgi:hypothetical protein